MHPVAHTSIEHKTHFAELHETITQRFTIQLLWSLSFGSTGHANMFTAEVSERASPPIRLALIGGKRADCHKEQKLWKA
jgi:hypothetical protein